MRSDLTEMKKRWKKLGIESHFPKIHHFSSPKFSTAPSSLDIFYNWCIEREIKEENLQTVRRALEAVSSFEGGQDITTAIHKAWKKYPVLMR